MSDNAVSLPTFTFGGDWKVFRCNRFLMKSQKTLHSIFYFSERKFKVYQQNCQINLITLKPFQLDEEACYYNSHSLKSTSGKS